MGNTAEFSLVREDDCDRGCGGRMGLYLPTVILNALRGGSLQQAVKVAHYCPRCGCELHVYELENLKEHLAAMVAETEENS